ncbi:retrovirus-related pol polyprotein from transposon TNT 1-94 [Tanacetum coccineum]
MYCDNKSAIALCCNNVQHSRSKHIDIRFHFIKEHVENGVIELSLSIHEYQLATSSRKLLAEKEFNFLINKAGNGKFYADTLKQFGRLKLIIGVERITKKRTKNKRTKTTKPGLRMEKLEGQSKQNQDRKAKSKSTQQI